MDIILENDELSTPSDSLTSEFGRSEGQGSWDQEEFEGDIESSDEESVTPDSPETLNDTEPDYPEEYAASKEDEEDEDEDDDFDDTENIEQKNTPQEKFRRVLTYSDYFSSAN